MAPFGRLHAVGLDNGDVVPLHAPLRGHHVRNDQAEVRQSVWLPGRCPERVDDAVAGAVFAV